MASFFKKVFNEKEKFESMENNEQSEIKLKPLTSSMQKVVAFAGGNGVGKTTLMLETAIVIKRTSKYNPKICILELDVLNASVKYKLHHSELIWAKKNIMDLLENINQLNKETLKEAVNIHEPTGIEIINSFDEALGSTKITHESIKKLIELIKEEYDLIFIDTGSNIREDETITSLIESDMVVMVCTEDLGNVMFTRKYISNLTLIENYIEAKNRLNSKIYLTINKHNNKKAFDHEMISQTLFERPILATISEDVNITLYQNNGMSMFGSKTKTAEELMKLAKTIYPLELIETNIEVKSNIGKEKWIELYGSKHLKNCIKFGYNAQRMYVEERWRKEFPEFELDFEDNIKWKTRSCPSEKALAVEMDIRSRFDNEYEVEVVWLTTPNVKMQNWTEREAVIIKGYLDKYKLVMEIK